jgi:uncharacterized membrane protein YfcA
MQNTASARSRRDWIVLGIIGIAAGFLSGFLGVGGGTIIVPALTGLLAFDQRRAAATSLAAIIPPAVVGVVGYLITGEVNWLAGVILIVGAVVGAWIGSKLLHRLPLIVLRWLFIAFLLFVAVSLFFAVPSRDAEVDITVVTALLLVLLGLVTGIISGLIGVGGGVILVPALMLLFGSSDLEAKGTSLLVMIPTTITGTFGNARKGSVDFRAAAVIGGTAAVTSLLGVWCAVLVEPMVGSILFGAYLLFIAGQNAYKTIKTQRAAKKNKD